MYSMNKESKPDLAYGRIVKLVVGTVIGIIVMLQMLREIFMYFRETREARV